MKKEISKILEHQHWLIWEHIDYRWDNIVIKWVDSLSSKNKVLRGLYKMSEETLCRIASKVFDKEYKSIDQFWLYYLEKEINNSIILNRKSFLGKIIWFFK